MYDKQVRRRRTVLIALVITCLLLMTAFFGDTAGGPLRTIQNATMEVVAPIQEGTNRLFKPVRDLSGWVGDTFDARGQRDALLAERDSLRRDLARLERETGDVRELRAMLNYNETNDIDSYSPVTARVYSRSSPYWNEAITINKGSGDGVAVGQPVLAQEALIGRIKRVSDGSAVVMLIADDDFGAAAIASRSRQPGTVQAIADGQLEFALAPNAKAIKRGDRIATAGTVSDELPSLFPPGLPIGVVSRIDGDSELDRTIFVKPTADLATLDHVQVLTKPSNTERAQTP